MTQRLTFVVKTDSLRSPNTTFKITYGHFFQIIESGQERTRYYFRIKTIFVTFNLFQKYFILHKYSLMKL